MDACPDFIGVVKIFAFLELESRYSGKHFSKVSLLFIIIIASILAFNLSSQFNPQIKGLSIYIQKTGRNPVLQNLYDRIGSDKIC